MTVQPALDAHLLNKTFGSGNTQVHAVRDVSLTIQPGELVLIMGPSGSGKTTLLSILGGLLSPSTGGLVIDGIDVPAATPSSLCKIRARKIGFIFQAFNLLEPLTVEENILFPARLLGGGVSEARQRADALIEHLGLVARRHHRPATLSGGEKQRVAIARALINKPPIILADEPTGNLDSENGQEVMMILHDIARDQGRAILMVTHDPRVEEVADRVLWLEDGALQKRRTVQRTWAKDPVCGMRVDQRLADIQVDWAGQRYHFCSARCLQRFQASPDQYTFHLEGKTK